MLKESPLSKKGPWKFSLGLENAVHSITQRCLTDFEPAVQPPQPGLPDPKALEHRKTLILTSDEEPEQFVP